MRQRRVVDGQLAASHRPGCDQDNRRTFAPGSASEWRPGGRGGRAVDLLLAEGQLELNRELLWYYLASWFQFGHVAVEDHRRPPLTVDQLEVAGRGFEQLRKPDLIHRSAEIAYGDGEFYPEMI